MKKLIAVCVVCMLSLFAAGAANVGTIDNGYPGDTEAQAQMLCDLGLFQGTEKGFELAKPMTRAEAAAMLTRLLGAEDEALSGDWTHPFTDVPSWADKYVGWLYENGLTKGTSNTTYGAEENVTCGQYCMFLARATTDSDDYSWLLQYEEDEEKRCNEAGFVRGDAVSLSVRLLGRQYDRVPDNVDAVLTVAHHLMDCGVYTAEQFRQAAWEVLPRQYARADSYGTWYTTDGVLSCVIAGVRVLADEDSQVVPDRDWIYQTGRLYGQITSQNGEVAVYRIDGETLETAWLFSGGSDMQLLCTAGDADYFVVDHQMMVVENDEARREPFSFPKEWSLDVISRDDAGDCWAFPSDQGICVVDDGGLRLLGTQPFNRVTQLGDLIVAQHITAQETAISAWTWDGKAAGSFTVDNSYPIPDGLEQESVYTIAYWLTQYTPCLQNDNGIEIWGSAGLYRVDDERLIQLTNRPTYAYSYDSVDGSLVIVTHAPDRHVEYSESAVVFRTGDTLMRILPDGTEEYLLPQLPEGSLLLGTVNLLPDGRVEFTTLKPTEPRMMGRFTCVLDDGKVKVTDATADLFYMWGEDAVENEQARLDALGIGIGAD